MLEEKTITLKNRKGEEKKFVLTEIPYYSGGREILTQFLPTAMPKVGDYQLNEALSKKLFTHISVVVGEHKIPLTTDELVHNHVTDTLMGLALEKEMLEHNFGFFDPGKISAFLKTLGQKAVASILPILTELRAQLSSNDSPPSTS